MMILAQLSKFFILITQVKSDRRPLSEQIFSAKIKKKGMTHFEKRN